MKKVLQYNTKTLNWLNIYWTVDLWRDLDASCCTINLVIYLLYNNTQHRHCFCSLFFFLLILWSLFVSTKAAHFCYCRNPWTNLSEEISNKTNVWSHFISLHSALSSALWPTCGHSSATAALWVCPNSGSAFLQRALPLGGLGSIENLFSYHYCECMCSTQSHDSVLAYIQLKKHPSSLFVTHGKNIQTFAVSVDPLTLCCVLLVMYDDVGNYIKCSVAVLSCRKHSVHLVVAPLIRHNHYNHYQLGSVTSWHAHLRSCVSWRVFSF